jgi:hypothetical protein
LWFAVANRLTRSTQYWVGALLALVVAAAITAPFLVPYAQIRDEGFARSLADARLFSADWRAYLASAKLAHAWMLPLLGTWQEVLFPGFLTIAFAGAALVQVIRRSAGAAARSVAGFHLSVAVLAAWASFGPDAGLYTVLFETLPFFELIRAPARFGVVVTMALVVLASFSATVWLGSLSGRKRPVVLVTLTVVALATSTVGTVDLAERRPDDPVYQHLARLPRGPVAEFPYFVGPHDRHRHTEYMFESLRHWQPLINGYSDHTPPAAYEDGHVLATFPSSAAWDVLRRRGARYVVMHWASYPDAGQARQALFATEVGVRLRLVVEGQGLSLFEVTPPAAR